MRTTARSRSPWPALTAACLAAALSACGAETADAAKDGAAPFRAETAAAADATLSGEVARMARGMASSLGGRTVAVFDFPDLKGQVTELGSLVSEQLTTEMVRSGSGRVLERKQVLQVLEELNLRKADLSTSEVEMAAEQLGADAIVVGSVSVVGRSIEVNARAVDVRGGNLLTADRFALNAESGLLQLAGRRTATLAQGGVANPAQASTEPGAPVTEATLGPVSATMGECRAASSEVTCTLSVMSATVDAGLQVHNYNESGARDAGGNAYRFTTFTFGSENAAEWNTLLVAKETTPAQFTLTGVPITMERLTRVAVAVEVRIGERSMNGELIFRNVPIAR
jgi:TolB-like protein